MVKLVRTSTPTDSGFVEQVEDFFSYFFDCAVAVNFGVFAGPFVEIYQRFGLLVIGGYAIGDDVVAGVVLASFDFRTVADAVENHLVWDHD